MAQANWDFPVLTTVRNVIRKVDEILDKVDDIKKMRDQLQGMEDLLGGGEGAEGLLDQFKERSNGDDVAASDPANSEQPDADDTTGGGARLDRGGRIGRGN